MTIPGVNVTVIDEPTLGPGVPTATDTAFLITGDTNGPTTAVTFTTAQQARTDYPTATTMIAEIDAILNEAVTTTGGTRVIATKLVAGAGGLTTTLAKFPQLLGPGQIVAPPCVASADLIELATFAWDTNRVYLANGPSGAADSALQTLAAAVVASGKGRNTALFADTAIIPGVGATTRTVPWAVVEAGLIARSDLLTLNPNLAVAGVQGVCNYAIGISAERTDTAMSTLNTSQVNVARAPVGGAPRNYGYRTLADYTTLPQWRSLGGSRVVMDIRANSAASSEQILFGQIDAGGGLLAKWNGLLSRRCLELLQLDALYGDPSTAFSVDTGAMQNPVSNQALGQVRAAVKLKTSEYAEQVNLSIIKRPITAPVA